MFVVIFLSIFLNCPWLFVLTPKTLENLQKLFAFCLASRLTNYPDTQYIVNMFILDTYILNFCEKDMDLIL